MSKSIVQDEQPCVELHQLPHGWNWSCLGDVGLVRLGKTPRKTDYRDHGDYKIVKFRDVDETGKIDWDNNEKGYVSSSPEILRTLQELRESDVLVTASAHMSGHIGKKVGIVLSIPRKYKHAFVVGELLRIRTNDGVDPRWVFYYLGSAEGYKAIQRRVHGVHLIGSRAQHIEVPVAPPAQQVSIVAEIEKQFSRLDKAVANLKRVKANLKRYKAAVLKAAVEGKLTDDWRKQHPNVEPASKLLECILAERRAKWHRKGRYKEPATPNIGDPTAFPVAPKGWAFVGMEQLLPPMREAMKTGPFGSLLKKHEHKAEGIAVLGIENIEAMRFVRGSKIHITQKKAQNLVAYKVIPDDVLISRSGTVGEVCVVPKDIGEARMSTNLMKVSLAPGGMLPKFFVLLFNGSPFVLNQVSDLCKGSTRSFLNQEILKQLCFVLPPLPEQIEIIGEVERRMSIIEGLEAVVKSNLVRADRLRQSILSRAFSRNS